MVSREQNQSSVRAYSTLEKYHLKTLYQFFQTIGESELHIETLRQKLAKTKSFEAYTLFRKIGSFGLDHEQSDMMINRKQIYSYIN